MRHQLLLCVLIRVGRGEEATSEEATSEEVDGAEVDVEEVDVKEVSATLALQGWLGTIYFAFMFFRTWTRNGLICQQE